MRTRAGLVHQRLARVRFEDTAMGVGTIRRHRERKRQQRAQAEQAARETQAPEQGTSESVAQAPEPDAADTRRRKTKG